VFLSMLRPDQQQNKDLHTYLLGWFRLTPGPPQRRPPAR
jgi:hypothetical protein